MKVFEDILYENGEYAITGFLNPNGSLEYTIYKKVDGGIIDLEKRDYNKNKLLKLLEIELEEFLNRNIPTLFILGHEIYLELINGENILRDELDDEVYEISHDIMQGNEYGKIFIESKNVMCSWNIIK